MNVVRFILIILVSISVFCFCSDSNQNIRKLLEEWRGREILYPSKANFVVLDSTNLDKGMYTILVYMDSMQCISCNLNLHSWNNLVEDIKSDLVNFQFVFHPYKKNELKLILKREHFLFPYYIDEEDEFNKLNHFPLEPAFQTFLLDKDNKVLAIGNPVLNPKVKELYLRIIQGKPLGNDADAETPQTTVSVSSTEVSLGGFPWQEPQSATLTLTNTGTRPLVIQDVVTSCGCLTVDYPREPVRPGGEAALRLTYKADNPGYFRKTVTVYANAEEAPLRVQVSGNAE